LQARLNAVEAAADGFEDAVSDAAIETAQGLLSDAVAPQIVTLQEDMDAITAAIALAEDALQALQTGGVGAENVTVAAYGALLPDDTNAQAAIEALVDAIVAEAAARTAADSALSDAIDAEAVARAAAIAAIPAPPSPGLIPIGTMFEVEAGTPVAALDFSLTGDYEEYLIKFWDLKPVADAVALLIRTSTDGGSSFDSGASDYAFGLLNQIGTVASATESTGTTAIKANLDSGNSSRIGNDTNETGCCGEITICAPSDAVYTTVKGSISFVNALGSTCVGVFAGRRLSAAGVDAARVLFSSNSIASGKAQLYRVVTG
jgi:hypothetical protein